MTRREYCSPPTAGYEVRRGSSGELPEENGCHMKIEITDEAKQLLSKRGGTMTIDFIKPTG